MRFLQSFTRPTRVDRQGFLVQAATGKKVLHVGCVDSGLLEERLQTENFLHGKLGRVTSELWGLDPDEAGIRLLESRGFDHLIAGSAEEPPEAVPRGYFDLVIAGEVIEHIRNVGRFLDSSATLLNDEGSLVITTPNALRLYNPFPALMNRELVHPDHVAWYSPHTLKRAVEMAPFQVDSMFVYGESLHVNPRSAGNALGRLGRRLLNAAVRPAHAAALRLAPYTADGLIVMARVKNGPMDGN